MDYGDALVSFTQKYVDRDDRETVWQALNIDALITASREHRSLTSVEFRALLPDSGRYEWFLASLMSPRGGKSYGTIQNVHSEKEQELLLHHRADHDPLTDLYNRSAFERELTERFIKDGSGGAFLIMDIDNFKHINDSRGHLYGDRVIAQIADILRGVMPGDTLIGRFGGDEFVFYLSGVLDAAQITPLMATLRKELEHTEETEGVTVSVGVALFPEHGATMGSLLECADRALYVIKTSGKNGFLLFDLSSMSDGETANANDAGSAENGRARRLRLKLGRRHSIVILFALTIVAAGMLVYISDRGSVREHSGYN